MTVWTSDTCICEIEFSDKNLKITKIINKCQAHNDQVGQNFIGCASQSYNVMVNKKVKLSMIPTNAEHERMRLQKLKDFIT